MKQLLMNQSLPKQSFARQSSAEQHPMKSKLICFRTLPALTLTASLFVANSSFASSSMSAQSAADKAAAARQPGAAPDQDSDQDTHQTFTGVIAKHGDKLVLTDPLTRTSYQLDDQRKAQELVNKNVKVTGVLDPSTGTIRVSAIDPI
jgi:hypothetical protein